MTPTERRAALEAIGWSQRGLADRIGWDDGTVRRWMRARGEAHAEAHGEDHRPLTVAPREFLDEIVELGEQQLQVETLPRIIHAVEAALPPQIIAQQEHRLARVRHEAAEHDGRHGAAAEFTDDRRPLMRPRLAAA